MYFAKTINNRGFTLTEAMIAVSISAIALTGLYFGMTSMKKLQTSSDKNISTTADSGRMGARFVRMVEKADVSAQFMHLPVATASCTKGNPCVRRLDPATKKFVDVASSSLASLHGEPIEFYRDHTGVLDNSLSLQLGITDAGKLTYTSPLDTTKFEAGHNLYATWPLIDSKSPSFPILSRTELPFVLKFEDISASSNPGNEELIVLIQGGLPDTGDINRLKDSLVVTYNSYDVRQYAVSKVSNLRLCVNEMVYCNQVKTSQGVAIPLTSKHAILTLTNLVDSNLNGLIPPASVSGGAWRKQSANYLFPVSLNVFKTGDVDVGESAKHHLRKWAHYNHIVQQSSNLIVLPVQLNTFALITDSNSGRPVTKMIRSEYRADGSITKFTEIDDVRGPIYFARELGTWNLQVHIFQSSQ